MKIPKGSRIETENVQNPKIRTCSQVKSLVTIAVVTYVGVSLIVDPAITILRAARLIQTPNVDFEDEIRVVHVAECCLFHACVLLCVRVAIGKGKSRNRTSFRSYGI